MEKLVDPYSKQTTNQDHEPIVVVLGVDVVYQLHGHLAMVAESASGYLTEETPINRPL